MKSRALKLSCFCLFLLASLVEGRAQSAAGTALRFDGTSGYLLGPADAELNPYPFTCTAWFRTTNTTGVQGIASKYADGTGNGWTLVVQDGRLRGFYYRGGFGNYAIDAFSPGLVADGGWHHAALAVDANGGRLLLDGQVVASSSWVGIPGAPATGQPLQIGRYFNYPSRFQGDIDEVSIWNRGLGNAEVNYVKHRALQGGEDGLVAGWRFNEGAGTESIDLTANARVLSLVSAPEWVASTAPIALSPVAGSALVCDGVDDQVIVPQTEAWNTLPLTIMAWVKTAQRTGAWPGLVAKYAAGSQDGFALALNAGRLAPWYYVSGARYVEPGFAGPNDRFIADNQWHHVAFVVDGLSARTFIDGRLVNTMPWVGAPGATTSAADLRFGTYEGSPLFFNGQLDQVSLWNLALSATEIERNSHLPLTGVESGLLSAYNFDEAAGDDALDLVGLSPGNAPGGLGRGASLARLGDAGVYLLPTIDPAWFTRGWAVQNSSAAAFPLAVRTTFRRFHDYGDPPATASVSASLDATLADAVGTPINLRRAASATSAFVLGSYNASEPPTPAALVVSTTTLTIEPEANLDSVNFTHAPTVTLSHEISGDGAGVVVDEVRAFPSVPLLHFNGTLYFGDVSTTFSTLANSPAPGASSAPDFVATRLQLPVRGGKFSLKPEIVFGGGAAFDVTLAPDGTATNLSGNFLIGTTEPLTTVGIRYLAAGTLGTAGAQASVLFAFLPTGLGVQTDPEIRAQYPYVIARNVPLNGVFEPAADPMVFTPAGLTAGATEFFFAEETKPVLFSAPAVQWEVAAGQFSLTEATGARFVRETEDDWLEADRTFMQNPLAGERVSNDSFYRHLSAIPGLPVYFRPDPANGSARLQLELDLAPGPFRPHLPYTGVEHSGPVPSAGGRLAINDDLIDAGGSYLLLGGDVPVPYRRDCPDTNCSGVTLPPLVLPFTTTASRLEFTPDGGLLALGTVPAQNLTWGYTGTPGQFTQRTSDVEAGAYHMPGTFLRGDQTWLEPALRPAVLLFSGFGDTGDPTVERPGQGNYAAGFANYGGLNFRQPLQGRSTLAGRDTGWYPLIPQAKYYVRYAGVSGIHQAASFPSAFPLSGYDIVFSRFALSYLDSDNWESRTDGRLRFPDQPAGFFVDFKQLKFLCRGALADAQLPPNTPEKHLNYWNVDFLPLSIEFREKTNNACSVADRFLVLGVQTQLPFIPEAFHATLGFNTNGNLVVAADGVRATDSRFALPPRLRLQGSGDSFFAIGTAGEGYFNNWETPGRPAEGFYNLAGRIDLPFFEDSKVHLHVTPLTTKAARIDIMGGWRAADQGGPAFGWSIGGKHYFNEPKFDRQHRGFPERSVDGSRTVGIGEYRNSPTLDFHPRAQADWIEVAKFDYPLVWNPALRQFASFEDSTVILPIINVDSRLKELTPGKVDLDFAQDLELKLPRLKLLDFANDAVNEISGPFNSLSNALRQAIGGAVDATGLTRGFRGMQRVLRDEMTGFFRPVLEPALDPVVDALFAQLATAYAANPANITAFRGLVPGLVNRPDVGLQNAIRNINGVGGQAASVAGQLNQALADIDGTLGLFQRMLQKDGSGHRNVVRTILQQVAADQGALSGIAGAIADPIANGLLGELEPTLLKLEERMGGVRRELNAIRTQLAAANGDFSRALGTVTGNASALTDYGRLAGVGVSNYLASVVTSSGDYFTANPAAARRALRDQLITAFLASPLPAKYQQTFKQFLSENDAVVGQLTETLFQQINQSIRNGLSSQFASAADQVYAAMKGPGLMSGSFASAQIRGAPTFNGDAMERIRLDAKVKFKLPDDLDFTAYMEIRRLDSQSVPKDCIPAGAPAAEIIIGAADVPLQWPGLISLSGKPLTLTVEARWTQQSGNVLGVGGLILIKGEIGFKGCSVREIGASMAFGELETYFAARAAGTITIVGVPVDINAGLFVGKACTLTPILFVDPEAAKVLGDPLGFRGVYVQFGAGLSLSEILFGTSNCFLDAEVSVTSATYYSDGPRSGKLGMRQKLALDVSLICLIKGHADLSIFSSLEAGPDGFKLVLGGEANLCGEIGFCPFCISGCVGMGIRGEVGDGGVDYSID